MKYEKNLRFSSGLIAALMLLASCGQSGSVSDPETTTASGTASEETTADYLTTIANADFGGNPFRILVNSASDRPNVHAGEENGEGKDSDKTDDGDDKEKPKTSELETVKTTSPTKESEVESKEKTDGENKDEKKKKEPVK